MLMLAMLHSEQVLAVKQPLVSHHEQQESVLLFELAGQQYAVPVKLVHEVASLATLIQLPQAPEALAGILRLRGALLPVVDLRARLGLPPTAPEIGHRIVITAISTSSIGLVVDAVHGLHTLDIVHRSAEPSVSSGLISGVFETPHGAAILLDLDAIICSDLATFLATSLNGREGPLIKDVQAMHTSRGLE
jgi:purine-binding chemotaxis protein CheW